MDESDRLIAKILEKEINEYWLKYVAGQDITEEFFNYIYNDFLETTRKFVKVMEKMENEYEEEIKALKTELKITTRAMNEYKELAGNGLPD